MARSRGSSRVSSFFEKWSHPPRSPTSPSTADFSGTSSPAPTSSNRASALLSQNSPASPSTTDLAAAQLSQAGKLNDPLNTTAEPPSSPRPDSDVANSRASSRPSSMVQTYQPPLMEVATDTPPELQPIFTFLNSHSNKLYQEGYFLKLHDLDTRGRPSSDRAWQECFAQLVGTVLSLWDAAELDAAGEDGEVVPAFINLADASIKMIESLPMNETNGQHLQNVLSISTAASNRYLLHFNSLNSLTQWTAGIRLAMYEHATLQEAYTGSLVAGKGKMLNNIRQILERTRFKYEDWARVRFGAGTPWRRCWFVISPPDEKEWEKAQKQAKKRNAYDKAPVLKGDIKFYETRKITKRTRPIATITDAFSAYAIYPQSKPLIDQSTLVKIEGRITIHSSPETTTDGFVFVMPEVHPAISGFEMMLRFLFPVWDTFALYGRPSRLIADVLDQRGLMFALPRDRRYGYLEILDVAGLIHTEGSPNWNDREWRRRLKDLTSQRMLAAKDEPQTRNIASRVSLPGSRGNVLRFEGDPTGRQTPAESQNIRRTESAMAGSVSKATGGQERPTSDSPFQQLPNGQSQQPATTFNDRDRSPSRGPPHSAGTSSDKSEQFSDAPQTPSPGREIPPEIQAMGTKSPPVAPVGPPAFAHARGDKPRSRLTQVPELRRGISDLDEETRAQMREATAGRVTEAQQQATTSPTNHAYIAYDPQHDHYRAQAESRGASPHGEYGRKFPPNQPNPPRLATIPASPFIEQDSPMDRAGRGLPPRSVPEQSRTPSPGKTPAKASAMLALGSSPAHSRSNPEIRRQASEGYLRQAPMSGGAGQPFVQRKPVGVRPMDDYAIPRSGPYPQGALGPPPANGHWNQQHHQPRGQHQAYGYSRHDGYGRPPAQGRGQFHNEWPAYAPGHGGFSDHQNQPPRPPMHGQLPYRDPAPVAGRDDSVRQDGQRLPAHAPQEQTQGWI